MTTDSNIITACEAMLAANNFYAVDDMLIVDGPDGMAYWRDMVEGPWSVAPASLQ